MRPIQQQTKNRVIYELEQGKSIGKVAKLLNLSTSTVHKYSVGVKTSIPKASGGRMSKLSDRDKAFCVRQVTKGGKSNASEVKKALKEELGVVVSSSTVRRTLNEKGLVAMVKPKKPLLSEKNVKARLEWAKQHMDWKRVIWSDETKINRFGSDGRHYTYKRVTEKLHPKHVKQTVKHGGGNIMIWGCITYDGPGFMTKIGGTMNKELYPRYPGRRIAFNHWTLQHGSPQNHLPA